MFYDHFSARSLLAKLGRSMVLEVVLMYMTLVRQSSISRRTAVIFDPSRHLCRQDVQTQAPGLTVNQKWAKYEQQASSYDSVNLPHIYHY